MRVGSLFTGIGGLDLGLERAGMTVGWQSEIDPYACRVLTKHWPDVPNLGDITTVDWSTVEHVDLICGGYPCQPFSLAGNRNGDTDPRHLWPHFRDAIRLVRPRWALLENVPGHLSLGFGRVLADLAEIGYDAEWDCIPAAAVGAPHLRYRVFVVAHPRSPERWRGAQQGSSGDGQPGVHGAARAVADAAGSGRMGTTDDDGEHAATRRDGVDAIEQRQSGEGCPSLADAEGAGRPVGQISGFVEAITRPERRGGQHVADIRGADHWAVEPDVGRVAHGVPDRVDRLRCLGNAVVPQVAEYVGRRIMAVTR